MRGTWMERVGAMQKRARDFQMELLTEKTVDKDADAQSLEQVTNRLIHELQSLARVAYLIDGQDAREKEAV